MMEAVVKISGFGWTFYCQSMWNKFDFFLVLASILDFIMTSIGSSQVSGVFNILRSALPLFIRALPHSSATMVTALSRHQPDCCYKMLLTTLSGPFRSQKLLRVTRISRMLKLIKSFRSLQSLFVTLWISLPAFWNVGALLILILSLIHI